MEGGPQGQMRRYCNSPGMTEWRWQDWVDSADFGGRASAVDDGCRREGTSSCLKSMTRFPAWQSEAGLSTMLGIKLEKRGENTSI